MAQNNPIQMYSPYGLKPKNQNNLGNSFLGPSQNPNPTSTNKNYDSFFNASQPQDGKDPLSFTKTKQQWQVGPNGTIKPSYAPGVTSVQDFADIIGGDVKRQEQANKLNFEKNMGAATEAKNMGMTGVNNMTDPTKNGESFFTDAENYLKTGQQQAKASSDKFSKQLDAANNQQRNDIAQANNMSNAAIATSQQGADRQASAIQDAFARNNANQNDQIANQMSGALPGTESQINEMQRFQSGEGKRQATSAIAGLQDQQISRTANLQQAKAQTFSQLSQSAATLKNASLNQAQGAEQNYIAYNNHLAALAQAHGVMRQQTMQTAAQISAQLGSNYGQMVLASPLQALSLTSSAMTQNEYAARYGSQNLNGVPSVINTKSAGNPYGSLGMGNNQTALDYMSKNNMANSSPAGGYGSFNEPTSGFQQRPI